MSIDEMLPDVKKAELDILCTIDDFCKKNNLRYTLMYGTLIGAVRHKGFIPWDDDIDICMPREDYEKFLKLWSCSPVDGYVMVNPRINHDFSQNFTKIKKDHTTFLQEVDRITGYHKGIFVDVFPYDRIADNAFKVKIQRLYAVLTMLYTRGFVPPKSGKIVKLVCKILLSLVPASRYYKMMNYFEKKFIDMSADNTKYIGAEVIESCTLQMPETMFDEFIEMEFENRKFSVSKDWEHILKIKYGDYMQLPPEEERVWKHHPVLIDLNHNYEELIAKENGE